MVLIEKIEFQILIKLDDLNPIIFINAEKIPLYPWYKFNVEQLIISKLLDFKIFLGGKCKMIRMILRCKMS